MRTLIKTLPLFFAFSVLLIMPAISAEPIPKDVHVDIKGADAITISQSLNSIANEFMPDPSIKTSTKCDSAGICNLMADSFQFTDSLSYIWIISNDTRFEDDLFIPLSSPVSKAVHSIAQVFLNLGFKLDEHKSLLFQELTCFSETHSCQGVISGRNSQNAQ